tara:strand:+ start:339 stop:566 length:228 start_codon:yes stop_codon:yes gene_type:complete
VHSLQTSASEEILSINEMLHKIEGVLKTKKIKMTEDVFSEMIGYNKRFNKNGDVMVRCLDCNFLTYDVGFIEQIF